MSEICLAVHDVAMIINLGKDLRARQIFPSLYRLPWPVNGQTPTWHIQVFSGEPTSHCRFVPEVPVSTLQIWPDTEVLYQEDCDGLFKATVEGCSAIMNPTAKEVHLVIAPDAVDMAERLGRLIVQRILRYEGLFVVHAGAVETHGGAVLICGASGMGKSTLAIVWACLGNARFMADDRCVIFRRQGRLWAGGISDHLGLTPNAISLLQELGIDLPMPLGQDSHKQTYDCHDVVITLCQDPYPIQSILILDDMTGQSDIIDTCPSQEAFARLWQASFYPGTAQVMQQHFEILTDMAPRVPCYYLQQKTECRSTIARLDTFFDDHRMQAIPFYPQAQQHSLRSSPEREAQATEILCTTLCLCREDAWESYPDKGLWREVLRSADRHGLLAPLAVALETQPLFHRLGQPFVNVLQTALQRASEARRIHQSKLRCLCEVLPCESGSWAVMNGPALAERFYPVPMSRYYPCLELLVACDRRSIVTEALGRLGYCQQSRHIESPGLHHCDVAIWENRMDLHEIILTMPRHGNATLASVMALTADELLHMVQPLSYDGIHIPALHPAHQVLLSCANAALDSDGSSLPELWDLACMLRTVSKAVCDEIAMLAQSDIRWNSLQQTFRRADRTFLDKHLSPLRRILEMPRTH